MIIFKTELAEKPDGNGIWIGTIYSATTEFPDMEDWEIECAIFAHSEQEMKTDIYDSLRMFIFEEEDET